MQGKIPEPAKWETTATTLRCESIDRYVTLTVSREWLGKCAWCLKYKTPAGQNAPRMTKAIREKLKKCAGPDCPVVAKYRDRLLAEETAKR